MASAPPRSPTRSPCTWPGSATTSTTQTATTDSPPWYAARSSPGTPPRRHHRGRRARPGGGHRERAPRLAVRVHHLGLRPRPGRPTARSSTPRRRVGESASIPPFRRPGSPSSPSRGRRLPARRRWRRAGTVSRTSGPRTRGSSPPGRQGHARRRAVPPPGAGITREHRTAAGATPWPRAALYATDRRRTGVPTGPTAGRTSRSAPSASSPPHESVGVGQVSLIRSAHRTVLSQVWLVDPRARLWPCIPAAGTAPVQPGRAAARRR